MKLSIQLFNDGKIVGGIFLVLRKALDTVDHNILLQKLESAGIRGIALLLRHSFLSDRLQYVLVDEAKSDFKPILFGVPQGSVLGSILFLIYINDMANLPLLGNVLQFADDTACFYPAIDFAELMQSINHDLQILSKFFTINKLTINANKKEFIVLKTLNKIVKPLSFTFNGTTIHDTKNVKYLGLYLNHNLKWDEHIIQLKKRLCLV